MNKNKQQYYFTRMVDAIHLIYKIYCSCPAHFNFNNFPRKETLINHLTKMVTTRGIHDTVLYYKTARMYLYRYLSGKPLLEKTRVMRITTDGIPVFLQDWIPLIRNHSNEPMLRIITSFLYIGRLYDSLGKLDVSSITESYQGVDISKITNDNSVIRFMRSHSLSLSHSIDEYGITQDEFAKTFLEGLEARLKVIPPFLKGKFYSRTTVGPMGPGLTSIIHEALMLSDQQISSIKFFMDDETSRWFDEIIRVPGDFLIGHPTFKSNREDNPTSRRITVVEDKEGKARVIAILDYWTQLSLRPLHDYLADRLRRIPSDVTFDQTGPVREFYMENYRKQEHHFSCFDLTAATDRMPIDLQMMVLKHSVNNTDCIKHVKNLLVGEPFLTKDNQLIKYEVGQPMGAYCSWPLMALTHHYIVHLAAERANISSFRNYLLLGDDIVIYHDDVAKEYQNVLSELGMEISQRKTLVSKDTMEFVKRIFHKGNDITPLSLAHLKYAPDHIGFGVDIYYENSKRGYDILPKSFFRELSKKICSKRGRSPKWYNNKLKDYYYFPINYSRNSGEKLCGSHIKKWLDETNCNIFSCTTSMDTYLYLFLESYVEILHSHFERERKFLIQELNNLLRGEVDYYTQFNQNKGDGLILKILEKDYVDLSYEYEHILFLIERGDYDLCERYKTIGRSMRMSDSLSPSTHQRSLLVKTQLYMKTKQLFLSKYKEAYLWSLCEQD